MNCNICPRKCNIDRDIDLGFCGASNQIKIAKYMVHNWEEPIISGNSGSGAIFFSHCNLKCAYCQNYQISCEGLGKYVSAQQLVEIFKELESKGVHNLNLVTPSHYAKQIIDALNIYKPKVPIVWNSNGYETEQTLEMIKDYIDVYLVDMKYMDNRLSLHLSGAKDYVEVCSKAILKMKQNQPKDILINNIIQKGVIVRHLVLPNEIENTFKVLEWLNKNLGEDCFISIMSQYTPYYKSKEMEKYNRKLKPIEYKRVINKINELKFKNGFYQDLTSANDNFVPDFQKFKD